MRKTEPMKGYAHLKSPEKSDTTTKEVITFGIEDVGSNLIHSHGPAGELLAVGRVRGKEKTEKDNNHWPTVTDT